MEWLFILGLIAGFVALAGRLKTAEGRLASIEEELAWRSQATFATAPQRARSALDAGGEDEPSSTREPAPIPVTVPKARREAAQERAIAEPSEALPPNTPAPLEETAAEPPARIPFRFDMEDIFGRRLPIWAGGVTLAVAGVFLVRYSIERGLITPLLRVIMAFLFGFGLLAGAEAAYRFRERVADPRVAQALAGAGLATLYAAFYLAGTQYGLIGQTLAFLGLALVTAGAIALSFRFGLPSAVLGLVGGFAAPALVGGEEANLPLLSLYLGLVTAGLVLSGERQQRPWMSLTALIGGLGWGAVLLAAGRFGAGEALALGLYLVVLGAVLPAFAGAAQFERPLRLAAALAASVQLAVLVDRAGYSPLTWGLYLLLGATLAWFGWKRASIREANAVAATVALILLAQWDDASGSFFTIVAIALAAIFAGVPLAFVSRGEDRKVDGWQLAGVAAALAAVSYATFGNFAADRVEGVLAFAMLALATLPAAGGWFMRARENLTGFAVQMATAAALVFAALLMVTPGWSAPLAAAAVFAGLFVLLRGRSGPPLAALLWGGGLITAFALTAHSWIQPETARLYGVSSPTDGLLGMLRWLAAAGVFGALAWRESRPDPRRLAEGVAVLLGYGAIAQILPRDMLAWSAAALAIALQFGLRDRVAARATALLIAAGWAAAPLLWWLTAGLMSLTGAPVLVDALPDLRDVAIRLLPVLAALVFVRLPLPQRLAGRIPVGGAALAMGVVVAHILFKQLFAIDTPARFVLLGLAERTVWEGLLLGGAWLAFRGVPRLGRQRSAASALAAATLAHFALYTGLLHNPLWTPQALGPWPIPNLALPAYAIAIAAALSLRRWQAERLAPAFDGVVMVLSCLAALTMLRQLFAGSIPAGLPLSQTEDLLRSLTGIVLALGFLWLGSRRGERSWRVGSLAIMLAAVAKVFLVDAAGLDGLLRVASFMALGFSLIGIGWVYSRQLKARPEA